MPINHPLGQSLYPCTKHEVDQSMARWSTQPLQYIRYSILDTINNPGNAPITKLKLNQRSTQGRNLDIPVLF